MKRIALILILSLCLILVATYALAAVDVFTLPWWTVDGGGGASVGAGYSLHASVGQPDAGLLQGGDFTIAGGFLGGAAAPQSTLTHLFLPLVIR
jgi:hypothetical protein